MTYIDLTHLIDEHTPVFPGDPQVHIKQAASFASDGYLGHDLHVGTHTGTHIDAPAHMLEGARTIGDFTPDAFVGQGKYIRILSDIITVEHLQALQIEEGDIVIIDTDTAARFGTDEYYDHYPVLDAAAALYLVQQKVKMVGMDVCSLDRDTKFPIHKTLLSNDILLIENLTNLKALSGKPFKVYALPLRLDLDGAPARVIAEVH